MHLIKSNGRVVHLSPLDPGQWDSTQHIADRLRQRQIADEEQACGDAGVLPVLVAPIRLTRLGRTVLGRWLVRWLVAQVATAHSPIVRFRRGTLIADGFDSRGHFDAGIEFRRWGNGPLYVHITNLRMPVFAHEVIACNAAARELLKLVAQMLTLVATIAACLLFALVLWGVMQMALLVYVAHPIGADDDGRRARLDVALAVGVRLIQAGIDPFVPGLWAAAGINADGVAGYERWMAYDFAWLEKCDAVLRVPGHSPGADREVARAHELGTTVFTDIERLLLTAAAVVGG